MLDITTFDLERIATRQQAFRERTRTELGRMEAAIVETQRTSPFCSYCWSRGGEWLAAEPAEPDLGLGASGPGWRCNWCGNWDEVSDA